MAADPEEDQVSYGVEEFRKRTPMSGAEYERARRLIPGGVGSAIQFQEPYPLYLARSKGSRVWDLDGNEYIDYSLCFAAMVAGHANPVIAEAVRRQLELGTLYGMPTSLAADMAEELQSRYPMLEMVRFTQSGVEATMTAVRLARAATGKSLIVKIEGSYHGAADPLLVSIGGAPLSMMGPPWAPSSIADSLGIPPDVVSKTLVVPFNDLPAMESVLQRRQGEVAGVILEPVMTNGGVIAPRDGYLQGVRDLTRRHQVVLIFDEVKVGCRIAPGGATERFGVEADLITLAKAIGGGTPLGAFGGRADLMGMVSPLGPAIHFGTYNANPLVLSAGLACLREVLVEEAYAHMEGLGTRLAEGQKKIITSLGIPAVVTQVGPLGGILFVEEEPFNFRDAAKCDMTKWREYWFGMLSRGVIPMGSGWFEEWSISSAHTDDDVDRTLEVTEEVLREVFA